MDIHDVSSSEQFIVVLKAADHVLREARKHKGKKPKDYPDKSSFISKHMAAIRAADIKAAMGFKQNKHIVTTQIPEPYPPCMLPIKDLEPIQISSLRLETHHRGTKIFLRVCTPPHRLTGIMTVVEDEEDSTALLQIYNQPRGSIFPTSEIIDKGDILVLKEPFFKRTADGSYSLRVDHVSDIIWLSSGDERIPKQWKRPLISSGDSTSMRIQGNNCVQNQAWAEALRYYSRAIGLAKSPEEAQLAYVNRSLVNLRLGRTEGALHDAVAMNDRINPTEKSLFREARALYQLQRYDEALQRLEVLLQNFPTNLDAKLEKVNTQARIDETVDGQYDFKKMYKEATKTPPLVDCATFSKNVEISESPGKGRGLFTTRSIVAGEILLCEKAYAYSYCNEDAESDITILMNLSTRKASMGGQAHLLTDIVQSLYHNPGFSRHFTQLHHDPAIEGPAGQVVDSSPVVNAFLVENIITLNSFGAPRTTKATFRGLFGANTPQEKQTSFSTTGIWTMASHINHSCVANCQRSFIGDMQIVRAARDLEPGTELLFQYINQVEFSSFQEIQQQFSGWGFVCGCSLCHCKKGLSQATLQKRILYISTLEAILNSPGPADIGRATSLLRKIEATYPGAQIIRPELCVFYVGLGLALQSQLKLSEAISMLVKSLKVLGFTVSAYSATRNGHNKKEFIVHEWGVPSDFVPWAFVSFAKVYSEIAPELQKPAVMCAKTAYAIVVGEAETFGQVFPDVM